MQRQRCTDRRRRQGALWPDLGGGCASRTGASRAHGEGGGVVAAALRKKKQSQELRCSGCGSLLAKLEPGKLNLQRGDLQASFDGRFHASIVCYRARCRRLSVVEVGS